MKIMLELTPKKKVGEEEMLFFPPYRISVDSAVLKFSTKARPIKLEQTSKQKGSISIVLAKQCENIGLTLK